METFFTQINDESFKAAITAGLVGGATIGGIKVLRGDTTFDGNDIKRYIVLGAGLGLLTNLVTKIPPSCLGFTAGVLASIIH